MADVRQNTAFLDDFDRADESPLSGGGNWAQTGSNFWAAMDLVSNDATLPVGQTLASSYWTPTTYSGDDAECWGIAAGGAASGTGWGVAIWKDVGGTGVGVDGYRFRISVGSGGADWQLHRYTNQALTLIDSATGAPSGNPGYMLIRRNGNDVEGWNAPTGDPTNFSLILSATDTTYTTGLSLALWLADNSGFRLTEFTAFGGGPAEEFIPQIYRRVFG